MSDHRMAEIIGAQMALSTPVAIAWGRVIRGEIAPEEAAALMEDPQERELALRVFAPPTDERREALLATLLNRLAAQHSSARDGGDGARSHVDGSQTVPDSVRESAVEVVRAWRWRWIVPATLAAAVVLALMIRSPEEPSVRYTLEPLRGDAVMRGAPVAAPLPSYSQSSTLHVVLRPSEPVEEPVGLVAFGRSREGQILRLALRPEIVSNGLVTIDVPVRDTGLHEGEWELVLVVGRPSALPSSWQEVERAERAGATLGCAVMHAMIRVR